MTAFPIHQEEAEKDIFLVGIQISTGREWTIS